MKKLVKTALIAVSLLLSAGAGFAADAKAPAAVRENVAGKAADAKATTKGALIDINSATEVELKAIPGVGDAFAAKIIYGRPYANKTQLKSRKILPIPLYEQIKERITAKQPVNIEKTAVKPVGKK